MPIVVTCGCGQKLQAPDALAGKRSKCPRCASPVAIPAPSAASPRRAAPDGLDPLGGDASDPLGLGDLGQYERSAGAYNQLQDAPGGYAAAMGPMGGQMPAAGHGWQQPAAAGWPQHPGWPQQPTAGRGGGKLKILLVVAMAGGAAVLLIVGAIVAAASILMAPTDNTVAQANSGDESHSGTTQPVESPTDDEVPPEATTETADDLSTAGAESEAETDADTETIPQVETDDGAEASEPTAADTSQSVAPPPKPALPSAIDQWRASDPGRLRGAIPVNGEETVIFYHSWQTQLLPYLGYEDLYQKFRFEQPWTENPNLALTQTVIPQFLNPADGREHWKGYPFNGSALTHFVGMSGVEDKRNVVAATLPRSDVRAGVFGYDRIAGSEEITDGLSQTIMILGSGEMAGPWAQGGGATIRGAREPYFDELTGFGSRGLSRPGTLAVFADGSVREVSADISPEVFRAMCTIHGAETVDQAHLGRLLERLPVEERPPVRE